MQTRTSSIVEMRARPASSASAKETKDIQNKKNCHFIIVTIKSEICRTLHYVTK